MISQLTFRRQADRRIGSPRSSHAGAARPHPTSHRWSCSGAAQRDGLSPGDSLLLDVMVITLVGLWFLIGSALDALLP